MPDNTERAGWAEAAVQTFMKETGTEREDAISDLIADLCHLCDADDVDPCDTIRRGIVHYYAETHHERAAEVSIKITPTKRYSISNEPDYERLARRAIELLQETLEKWNDEEESVKEEKAEHIAEITKFLDELPRGGDGGEI